MNYEKIFRMMHSSDAMERVHASSQLAENFEYLLEKNKAWNQLYQHTKDKNSDVRLIATMNLGWVFHHVQDKKKAWDDAYRVIRNEKIDSGKLDLLKSALPYVIDKEKVWNDLHQLTKEESAHLKIVAAHAIRFFFPHIPDKEQACDDIYRLIHDKDRFVRMNSGNTLCFSLVHFYDKDKVWHELYGLIKDHDYYCEPIVVYALGSVFLQVHDQEKAWRDIHKLTQSDWNHQYLAAYVIGSVFSNVPNKKQACEDLIRLAIVERGNVQNGSNYSLGRISIIKAIESKTEEGFRNELVKALKFFKKCYKKCRPAGFCFPFYRSFYSIIYTSTEGEVEIQKYLADAKNAIGKSEIKQKLLEAIENLANVLKEIENKRDFNEMQFDLNDVRKRYIEQTEYLLATTEEKAPIATELLLKGLPIFDKKMQELIKKIQKQAKIACQQSEGTPIEEIACAINQEVQKWYIGDQEQLARNVENLIFSLKAKIPDIKANKDFYKKTEDIKKEMDLVKQYEIVSILISLIPQTVIGEAYMGDKYAIGQAGAVGPGAHAHDMKFNQIFNQARDKIELSKLADELVELRLKLKEDATEPEHDIFIGAIASAESSAKEGNGPKALEYLSKAGKWALDKATKIGVPVATEALKTALEL